MAFSSQNTIILSQIPACVTLLGALPGMCSLIPFLSVSPLYFSFVLSISSSLPLLISPHHLNLLIISKYLGSSNSINTAFSSCLLNTLLNCNLCFHLSNEGVSPATNNEAKSSVRRNPYPCPQLVFLLLSLLLYLHFYMFLLLFPHLSPLSKQKKYFLSLAAYIVVMMMILMTVILSKYTFYFRLFYYN